jgi:hypothetical protein
VTGSALFNSWKNAASIYIRNSRTNCLPQRYTIFKTYRSIQQIDLNGDQFHLVTRGRYHPIHGMHTLYFQKEYYLTYHSPTFRTIALGSVLFLLLIAILLRSAEVIKLIGSPLLFLPEKLHLIECLHAYDVACVDSDGRLEVILDSSRSGRFAIFTAIPPCC